MSQEYIEIKGARVNNLKNVDVRIPRDKFVVIAGVSGSGKSSLAFDTLYAEGQRRYVESLSSYARQFLGRMNKPECDFIHGLPPAIAIEQKVIARNPRSTVGTSTEIYEYLRLLFARIGHTYSPVSGQEVKKHTTEDVVRCMQQFSEGTKFLVLAPLIVPEGRTVEQQLKASLLQGYSRMMAPETPPSAPGGKAPLSSPGGDTIDSPLNCKTIEAPSGAVGGASLQVQYPFGQPEGYFFFLLVNAFNQLLGSRDERAVRKAEQNVHRALVDTFYDAHLPARSGIDNGEAHKEGIRQHVVVTVLGQVAGEVNVGVGQLAGTLLTVHALQLQQGRAVRAESVFLDEERHQYAVDFQHDVVGVGAVEYVVVELKRHLAVYAVSLAQTAYAVDIFLPDHDILLICAPRALSRVSIFS